MRQTTGPEESPQRQSIPKASASYLTTLSYSLTKSPKVTGKSTALSELKGSTPRESSSRATRIAKLKESRPQSMSAKSSVSVASLRSCSPATCSNCDLIVDLTDMLLAPDETRCA